MIRVGLVGIGGMGKVHFNAYKNVEDAKVVAVADIRCEMAKEKVEDDSIKIYSTMEEMLANEELDMVDICTPSYLHAELTIKALNSGLHVLCEKPMSNTYEETIAMKEAAEKSGKFLMVAHVVRFMYAYEYLKSVVDSGELGKVVHIYMRRSSTIPSWSWEDWMRDLAKSGGTPYDLSIHDIDYVQSVFGEPKKVSGVYRKLAGNSDCVVSHFIYDDFDITMSAGWYNCTFAFRDEYLALFENGYVENVGGVVTKNGEEVKFASGTEDVSDAGINIKSGSGYEAEIRYFVDCVKNNIKPDRVTIESSQASVKLVDKIIESAIINENNGQF